MVQRRALLRSAGFALGVGAATAGCLSDSDRPYELFVSNGTDQRLDVTITLLDGNEGFKTESFDIPVEKNEQYEWSGQIPDEVRVEWLGQTVTKQVDLRGGQSLDGVNVLVNDDDVAVSVDSR